VRARDLAASPLACRPGAGQSATGQEKAPLSGAFCERGTGFEPATLSWEAHAAPHGQGVALNHAKTYPLETAGIRTAS
jgi:hypothetical protein